MSYLVQMSIPYFTNLPEDVVVNTWHFDWLGEDDPIAGSYTNLANLVGAFYERIFINSTNQAMASWMRPALATTKIYDLVLPTPRVPVYDAANPLTVTQSATGGPPTEVAACLSYHTTIISGVAAASQRGRIYLGGLGGTTITVGSTSTFPQIAGPLQEAMGDSAAQLLTDQVAVDWQWIVYSRKLGISTGPVIGGWVDDAADTQRRRGQQPAARNLWPD